MRKALAVLAIILAVAVFMAQVNNPPASKVSSLSYTNLFCSATAPTVSSGFGTSPSIPANNGTCEFTLNVGGGGAATTGVIGLPAATTGWDCTCVDITTQNSTVDVCKQVGAGNTTTVTVGNFTDLGAAGAWAANDILNVRCQGF